MRSTYVMSISIQSQIYTYMYDAKQSRKFEKQAEKKKHRSRRQQQNVRKK